MKKSFLLVALVAASALVACSGTSQCKVQDTTAVAQDSSELQLVGKRLLLDYGDMQAEVDYLSESSLHWAIKLPDGTQTEGNEEVSYRRLSPSSFFVSWIEADGTTVSQVLDLRTKSVQAYLTMAADSTQASARGGRQGQLLEGRISER